MLKKTLHILGTSEAGLVIVDEVGKLELAGEGFHQSMMKLVGERFGNEGKDLLLVVRDSLVGEVVEKYALSAPRIVQNLALYSY